MSTRDVVQVTAMIFTLDESVHLSACLASLAWCDDVVVVDSFSTDDTVATARAIGARVVQHRFEGFGAQRNWALDNVMCRHPWVLILDADERVPPEMVDELRERIPRAADDVGAFRLRRRFHMWGRWLRHSSLYPTWVVRLVRVGRVRYVNRGHAETQSVDGVVDDLHTDLIDENLKGIDEWFERQNRYARKEAEFELDAEREPFTAADLFGRDPLARRAALKRLASRMPARGLAYFVYGYFIRRGFLDGRDGFTFCTMRAMYQSMIAIKKYDRRRGGR